MRVRAIVEYDVDDEYYSFPETPSEERNVAEDVETVVQSVLLEHGDGKGIVVETLKVTAEVLHPVEQPIEPYY
jgi:hypothetical protein